MKEIYTGYKDMDGREYKVGDIVLNTFFGDYWVVAKNRKNEKIVNIDYYYITMKKNIIWI